MSEALRPLVPDPAPTEGFIAINGRCQLRTLDGHRVVLVAGVVVGECAIGDRMAEAHVRVNLVEQGWADQREVARAFHCSTRTVRREQRRFEAGGLIALGRPSGYPAGRPRTAPRRRRRVAEYAADGVSAREIARREGVCDKAIRNLLRRLGFQPRVPEQTELPLSAPGADSKLSASASPPVAEAPRAADAGADSKLSVSGSPPVAAAKSEVAASPPPDDEDGPLAESFDRHADDRTLDRLLACLGYLDDAAPVFANRPRVPHAGVLLAIPALLDSGVLSAARAVYGSLGPAFYGLRTTIVTLLLMALLRIKRPENLKEHAPPDLGHILGLDRAPEVKTLRRKLARLGAVGRAVEFGRALARHRVKTHGDALGFLYIDGHVRVYHGGRPIPKAHVTRMRIALPATTDYWINDARGDPLFVVTAQANAGLVQMMTGLLAEVRALVGERRLTFVFDRGGWSPRLFQSLLDAQFDFLTYRKGKTRPVPRRLFCPYDETVDRRRLRYTLADRRVRLRGCLPLLRQVTRLGDDGHQSHIITSRHDLRPVEVAFHMFDRWRQENYFKYLRDEYALDALVDYQAEPDDPTREVPNPRRAAVDAELHAARRRLDELRRDLGTDLLRTTLADLHRRGAAVLDPALRGPLAEAMRRVQRLEQRRRAMPARIPVGQRQSEPVIKLATERKHLTSVLKMVAYQIETELVRLVAPHFHRTDDEGRTLIQAALASAADLRVTDDQLHVTLAPQSAPHRTAAIAALCTQLNARAVRFPGSALRLHFAIASPPPPPKSGHSR